MSYFPPYGRPGMGEPDEADAPVYTAYEEVGSGPPKTVDASGATLPALPGGPRCLTNDCPPAGTLTVATTSYSGSPPGPGKPATVAATVTPLPATPKSFPWALVLAGGALALLVASSSSPALNGPAEPPQPQALGRPPRKPTPRHVAKLTLT